MSEMTESYKDLVKQLKPLSVVLTKISDEKYTNLKVVDDPNRIKDEVVVNSSDETTEEEEEEKEVEIDLIEAETNARNELNDCLEYSCFFCKKQLIGYNESLIHLQLHIDYYPIQCSICDEAITDLLSFVKHCRKSHPELERAKYIHKFNPIYYNWIHNFLTNGPNPLFKNMPHKYCPVCDWAHLWKPEEPTVGIKAHSILHHIHEHILYMPFSCIKCRENGKDFRIHALDNSTKDHIKSEHKELEPPFWLHYSKKYSIPSLDKFIANYLNILGIKIPKKRKTKKKSKPIPSVGVTDEQTIVLNNIPVNNQKEILSKVVPINSISLQTLFNSINVTQVIPNAVLINGNDLKIYEQKPLALMENPIYLMPSNAKSASQPLPVEATDLGIIPLDPKIVEIDDKFFKYMCVFCSEEKEFESRIEMCLHLSIHFSYYPIICMLCDKSFLDLSTLLYHYNKEHNEYKNNLFHYLKEDEKIEKWINSFVDYQKTHEFKANVSATYGDYCFVCEKLAKNDTSFRMKCEKSNSNAIRTHINQHLHYFPFKCLICFHGNREVRFSSLNKSAINHIINIHNLNAGDNQKALDFYFKFIIKTEEILVLEKFIDNKLFPERNKSSEPEIILNLKRKLEEIETENKKRLENCRLSNTTNSLPSLPSAQVLPIIRHENSTVNNSIKTYTTRSPNNNLNSMLRFTPSPQKPMNGIKSFQVLAPVTTVREIEYIPKKSTYIEPYLFCFHCHQKVANTKELESHHQKTHPKLTIASYAPTKRDLISMT